MKNKIYDLLVDLDNAVTRLELINDTFVAIDEAMRTGESELPRGALYMPCATLRELSGELEQIAAKVSDALMQNGAPRQ